MTVSPSVVTFFQTQYPALLASPEISASNLDEVIVIENDLLSSSSSEQIQECFEKLSELKTKAEKTLPSSREFSTKFQTFCEKLNRIGNIVQSSLSEPSSPSSSSPKEGSPLTKSEAKRKERSGSDPTKKLIDETKQEILEIKGKFPTLILKDIPGVQDRVKFLLDESRQQSIFLSRRTRMPGDGESLLETQASLTTIQQDLDKIQSSLVERKKVLGSEAAKSDVSRDFGTYLGALVKEVAVTEGNFLSNITVLKKMYTEEVKGNPFTANVAKSFKNAEQLDSVSRKLSEISESTDSIYEKVGQLIALYKSDEFSEYYFNSLLPLLEQHSVISEINPLIMGKEALQTLRSTTGLAATHKKQHDSTLKELKGKGSDQEAVQEVKAKLQKTSEVLGKRSMLSEGLSDVFQRVMRHPLLCETLEKEINRHIEKLKKELETEIPESRKTTVEAEIKQFEGLSSELHEAYDLLNTRAKKLDAAKSYYEPVGLLRAYLLASSDPIRTDQTNKELEAFIQNVVQTKEEAKFTIASKREELENKLREGEEPLKTSVLNKIKGKKEQGRLMDAPKIDALLKDIETIGKDADNPDNQIIIQSIRRSVNQLFDEATNNPGWDKKMPKDLKDCINVLWSYLTTIKDSEW